VSGSWGGVVGGIFRLNKDYDVWGGYEEKAP